MNSSQQFISISKYVSSQRRSFESRSLTYRDQSYIIYENLYARYSILNSLSIRMPHMQRSLSAENLYERFHEMSD